MRWQASGCPDGPWEGAGSLRGARHLTSRGYRLRSPAFAVRRTRPSGSCVQMNARSRAGALFARARGNAGARCTQDAMLPATRTLRVDARRWVPRDAEESLLLNLGRRFSSDAVRAHVRTHRISYVCIPNPSTPWTTNAASQPASPSRCAMQRDSMRAFKPEPVTALEHDNIQRTPAFPPPYPRFATLRAGRDASSAT